MYNGEQHRQRQTIFLSPLFQAKVVMVSADGFDP
jgi:hypothetical protein